MQSMITSPSAGDILSAKKRGDKTIKVKGIAWGGGGAGINRVDVSLNNGKDFTKVPAPHIWHTEGTPAQMSRPAPAAAIHGPS